MPDLSELERRMIATKAALDGARAGHKHCPNAENARMVEGVQQTLDQWLDAWAKAAAEKVVSA